MEGPPLGPGGEDITWPDQVAPRGRKASSTRKIKPQTSNLHHLTRPPAATTPPASSVQTSTTRRSDPAQKARPPHTPSSRQHRPPRSPQTGRGTPSKPSAPTHQRWTRQRHRSHPQKHLEPSGPQATPQNGSGGHTLGIVWRKPHGTAGGPPHHHPPPHPARGRALHRVRGTTPHNGLVHPLQPPVRATMRGRSATTPTHHYLQGGHIPRHYNWGPTPLPPARGGPPPRHTATPC